MTLNEDKYRKSVWLKSWSIIIHLMIRQKIATEVGHFHTFQTSLTLKLT